MNYRELARKAIIQGDSLRRSSQISPTAPICIYDTCQRLGIEVRFRNIPSLEGVYSRKPRPILILGSNRPIGRQAFNCAHELGHHVFGHGESLDALGSLSVEEIAKSENEFLANCFASHFLVPQVAILHALRVRNLTIPDLDEIQLFRLANMFEVGYSTLVNHLTNGCRLLLRDRAADLLKISPKHIRAKLLGSPTDNELVLVDRHWTDRCVDIRIGDHVLAPRGTKCDGPGIQLNGSTDDGVIFEGVAQSPTSRLINTQQDWCHFVRVMPREYEGLSEYRHMEELDAD